MDINNDAKISKTDNFVETVVDDELVLLHIINGQFYSLKDTGRRAWELLDDNPQFGQLCSAMCGEYDVTEDTCRSELGKLFGDLKERTLVEIN